MPEYVCTARGDETLHDDRTCAVRGWQCNLCTKISQVNILPDKTSTDDSEGTDNEINCSRWTVSTTRNVRVHGRKNGVEVLYFELKPLLWQDCLAAPFVSVQIITGIPTWTKAERSGPGAVGLYIFYRSVLVTNTCVLISCPLEKWLYMYCGCAYSV